MKSVFGGLANRINFFFRPRRPALSQPKAFCRSAAEDECSRRVRARLPWPIALIAQAIEACLPFGGKIQPQRRDARREKPDRKNLCAALSEVVRTLSTCLRVAPEVFFLAPRRRSGERTEERGRSKEPLNLLSPALSSIGWR